MTRPGHRATLTPAQTRALARPIRFQPRERPEWLTAEREADAITITSPALFRWASKRAAA